MMHDPDTIQLPDRAETVTFAPRSGDHLLPEGLSLHTQAQAAAKRVEASYPVVTLVRETDQETLTGDPGVEVVLIPTRTAHSHAIQDAVSATERWTLEADIDLEVPREEARV